MKILLSLFLFFILMDSLAQSKKNVYNTKIKSAGKVSVKNDRGGVVVIYNAKKIEIGKIIVEKIKTRVFLKSMTQIKDTSGLFLTTISFANPDVKMESENVNILVQCNAPIKSAKWSFGGKMTIAFGISEEFNLENGIAKYTIGKLNADNTIILSIISDKQIKPIIKGVDGKF